MRAGSVVLTPSIVNEVEFLFFVFVGKISFMAFQNFSELPALSFSKFFPYSFFDFFSSWFTRLRLRLYTALSAGKPDFLCFRSRWSRALICKK